MPGLQEVCGLAFRQEDFRLEVSKSSLPQHVCEDRLLSRGALDAAQSRRGFGQVECLAPPALSAFCRERWSSGCFRREHLSLMGPPFWITSSQRLGYP